MKASVAGKPYVIVMELVLAVLALVIIWHVFSKFFGFGAGILQEFIEGIAGPVAKKTLNYALSLGGRIPSWAGGALAGAIGCAIVGAIAGVLSFGVGTAITLGTCAAAGGAVGWWSGP